MFEIILYILILSIILFGFNKYSQYKDNVMLIESENQRIQLERLKLKKVKIIEERAIQLEIERKKKLQYLKDNKEYQLNTHKVKYNLYDHFHFSFATKKICNAFIEETLWIQEPFYTTFFNILQILDSDNLMVRDFNSDVMILNIRDKNGEDTISKSFEVVSTKEYLCSLLMNNEKFIKKFNKNDAQLIVFAISMIVLKKSMHFQDGSLDDMSNQIFSDKNYFEKIQEIINLIESNNEQLSFINKALDSVFKALKRYPYNTTEKLNRVVIPNFSQKTLLPL